MPPPMRRQGADGRGLYREPAIFPTDEIIAKSEASIYLGEGPIRLRDEAWTRIQAAAVAAWSEA
jgi:hypothetical protein